MSLDQWLDEVVDLHGKAARALRVEVVHDLRVAIRRCRSLAQGLREVDDDDGAARFKALSDVGRPLFQGLGDLRDAQVMKEHIARLLAADAALPHIIAAIDKRIVVVKHGARAAVAGFDVAAWRASAAGLSTRARALLLERRLFDHLSLRRFFEAREMHNAAMRSKSAVALHELRIGVKKLRYSIENFLPDVHDAIGKTLKKLQEVLGDIHDLDVLVAMLASEHVHLHSDDRSRVTSLVRSARDVLVAEYRALALGPDSAWPKVRACLVDGPAVAWAHEALMLKKASAHGSDPAAARAMFRSAHVLVHGLRDRLKILHDARAASLIRWACACAGVDGGGKPAAKLVRKLPLAVGFSERDRRMLAVVVRGVVGRAPAPDDAAVLMLPVRDRQLAVAASAVLHLSVALTSAAPFVVRMPKRSKRDHNNGEDGGGVVVIATARPIADPRQFAERRAPLEVLLALPLWWRAPASSSAG